MIKARVYLAGLALAAAASAAHAGLSVTPTVVTDYDFRGYSQSGKDPAIQLGVDYSSGPFHVGAWGSNVDGYGDSDAEVDLLADFTFGSDETVKFNTGVVYYTYMSESSFNMPEAWFQVSKGWFSGKLSYSWDQAKTGKDAYYVEGNGTFPLGESGFSILAHAGYSDGQYWGKSDYWDYSFGVGKAFGNFSTSLKFVTSDAQTILADQFNNEDRVILSVSTTLPWAK